MKKSNYLDGANPYPPESIREFTSHGWWRNLTYGDILDESAASYPDKCAVIDDRTELSYRELKEKVDRLSVAFLSLGIKKYDRILLQLPNRHEFIVAFYAGQKIGTVPILAVPRQEHHEISHFLKLMQPVAWVVPVTEGNRDFLPLIQRVRSEANSPRHFIMPDDGEELPSGALSIENLIEGVKPEEAQPDFLQRFRPDPNDVAILFLTGGTTGLPKGVPRTHNSFLTNVRYTNASATPDDICGLATPIGHTMAHQGPVGGSIMYGCTLVLISVPRAKPILDAIRKHRITRIGFVPTQLEDILNHPDLGAYDLSSLKTVGTTGAALRLDTAARARALFGKIGVEFGGSAFGSTEGPCAGGSNLPVGEVPYDSIGRPLCDGDHWKVIDDAEWELPPDTEGELVARGPCVFTGYYKSGADNKTIFTRDGYYKMGDLGKIDERGNIFITGRKKDIIQRGGEGIVPGEIEALLQKLPSIEAAAVVGMPDPRLGERACAFVVPKPGKAITFEEMTEGLKELGAGVLLLPERLETISELPRTAVGKIDKKALRTQIEERLRKEEVQQK